MIPTRVVHYRDPAAVYLGLEELRRRGLTPRGILFIALDPRGETHIAIPDDMGAVTEMKVGDKLTLKAPWEGRYYHFDAIHRLPGDTLLWNGDRRLHETGSAQEVALSVSEWLRGSSAKNLFLGCTPHQPGAWWTHGQRTPVTSLHQRGFVDAVVYQGGLLARRIGEPHLYALSYQQLAQGGGLQGWEPVFDSPLGNILMVERRVMNYRLTLTCERGLIEIDISGLPDEVRATVQVELELGYGVVGRVDGGGFAVTRGEVQPWGLANVSPALMVGTPNDTLVELARALNPGESTPSAQS